MRVTPSLVLPYQGAAAVAGERVYVVRSFAMPAGVTPSRLYADRCDEVRLEGNRVTYSVYVSIGGRLGFDCRYLTQVTQPVDEITFAAGGHLYLFTSDTLARAAAPRTTFETFVASFGLGAGS